MEKMFRSGDIDITFYVNPNLFWFQYKEDGVLMKEKRNTLDNKIQCYAKSVNKKHNVAYSPFIGERVIVRHCSGSVDKWIRARVDHEFKYGTGTEFILWIIDYGFPLRSSARFIRKLELDLQIEENETIFKGGMICVPAVREFNFLSYTNELVKKNMWSEAAVNGSEEMLFNAETVTFSPKINLNGHFFGDLVVKLHSGKSAKLSDLLYKTNESMNSQKFLHEYESLIRKPYWEENEHQKKFFKIQENYTSLYVNDEGRHASTSASTTTNKELNQKISDWQKRNTFSNDHSTTTDTIVGADNNSVENKKQTTCNKGLRRPKTIYSTNSQRTLKNSINQMKRLDISDVPLNKRYDFISQTESDNEKRSQEKLDRIHRIEQKANSKIYPAGYRV